jgi:hypothetical protein
MDRLETLHGPPGDPSWTAWRPFMDRILQLRRRLQERACNCRIFELNCKFVYVTASSDL